MTANFYQKQKFVTIFIRIIKTAENSEVDNSSDDPFKLTEALTFLLQKQTKVFLIQIFQKKNVTKIHYRSKCAPQKLGKTFLLVVALPVKKY